MNDESFTLCGFPVVVSDVPSSDTASRIEFLSFDKYIFQYEIPVEELPSWLATEGPLFQGDK